MSAFAPRLNQKAIDLFEELQGIYNQDEKGRLAMRTAILRTYQIGYEQGVIEGSAEAKEAARICACREKE